VDAARAAGERDALVEPEQAGRAGVVPGRHRDIAHQLAGFFGRPVQRGDGHFLERPGSTSTTRPLSSAAAQ